MPRITANNNITFEVPAGQRLVLALKDNGVELLHRCGGNARCTTCRVVFKEGEPEKMTQAEYDRLSARGLLGQVRLSCQIVCDHDMTVEALNLFPDSGLDDPGPRPEDHITPEPVWIDAPEGVKPVGD